MKMKPALILLVWMGSVFAQVPSGLTVRAATRQRVDLSWTGAASSYSVQRRALGGSFTNVATVSGSTASDTTIDAFTTYQYQIVAVSGSATPSNLVTVGPPPSGFSLAAKSPGLAGSDLAASYGFNISLVLDGNGDPDFAFLFQDPNQDGDDRDTQVMFGSWNRAQYRWNPVVRVATVGEAASVFEQSVSLGYDSSTNAFAIASEQNEGDSIGIFVSTDGGLNWTAKTPIAINATGILSPSLALRGGNIYLAFVAEAAGVEYATGPLSGPSASWAIKTAPKAPGTDVAHFGYHPSLALDSSGAPGVAYWVPPSSGSGEILLFWRPEAAAFPVRALDSQGRQSDELAVKLAFSGNNPRVAVYVQRDDADFGVGLHFARSQDGGATWPFPAVVIPADGNSSTDWPFDLALDSQGRGAISFGQNSTSGDQKCGNPKLSLSADMVAWRTCAAAGTDVTGSFAGYPTSIAIAYGGDDKLYLLWQETNNNPTGAGVVMWREPPTGESTAPALDAGSVHNGATDQPNIVAGSWAQVKGQNLSGVTRIWGDADFNNGNSLPTSLSGVQVRVNNLPAAVYYISPGQINFQVPSGVSSTVTVQVIREGMASNTVTGSAVANAPGLFSYIAGAKSYPAAVFANSFLVVGDPTAAGSAVRKAVAGDRIQLYATGLQSSPSGVIMNSLAGVSGVTASIGAAAATVEFAGLVAVGEYQINIIVPNLAPGEYPVVIQYNGQSSQGGVIVPIGP